ncbi:unnamed protein product [Dovyalis caffra]|uniref:Uncharacterized protein n=1 Tax=Dovyalis caffra TaxID=77055 RepID=A0AAV1S2H7_9ROSI|nr:unnamed protein product [Dovyalis caffra]
MAGALVASHMAKFLKCGRELRADRVKASRFGVAFYREIKGKHVDDYNSSINAELCFFYTNLTERKLKTQSDIDSILAKLNQNVKDCEILIKSGVLHDGILSGSSSKRELVRAEFRNLITRLQIGSTESKNAAMDSVLSLIPDDDKNVMVVVGQGIMPVLVRLLNCNSCFVTKEKSVAAISRILMVDSSEHVLIAEGLLLNKLNRILGSESGAIGSKGGICSLLEICQAGTHTSQSLASGVRVEKWRGTDEADEAINQSFQNANPNGQPYYLALAFDKSTPDYKFSGTTSHCCRGNPPKMKAEVFALKTNAWRRRPQVFNFGMLRFRKGIHVKGAIHWLATYAECSMTCESLLVAFDLAEEKFEVLPKLDLVQNLPSGLKVLGEFLCLCV